jgi:predicted nucleic acid-binding protein
MPEIVCNTTPLQYLHQAGLLYILPTLYGRILVPMAVTDEIAVGMKAGVNLPDLAALPWIKIREVPGSSWPMPRDIHRGEAEVIALAGSLEDPLLILDDLAARRHAKLLGLRITGTLGVLLKAKKSKILESVSPALDRIENAGFRLAANTRRDFLEMAGEM